MTTINLQLIIQLLIICNVFCNDSILSKFHQIGYKLRDARAELINVNNEYFDYADIKTFKINRTTAAVNATFRFKQTIEDKMEAVVQVYKFLSNEYRTFPIRFQVNVRKGIESDAIGAGSMKNCGNLTVFYFEKDVTYHVCNFLADESKLPPLIPNGRYKIVLQLLYLEKYIGSLSIFAEVYTPIDYPKTKKNRSKSFIKPMMVNN